MEGEGGQGGCFFSFIEIKGVGGQGFRGEVKRTFQMWRGSGGGAFLEYAYYMKYSCLLCGCYNDTNTTAEITGAEGDLQQLFPDVRINLLLSCANLLFAFIFAMATITG